jgi:hydrogenase maturation protease
MLIGIGNEYRGDDGLGVMVARELRRRAHPGLAVVEQSGEGTSLIAAWQGAHCVQIVDAAACGEPPGTIYRFDVTRQHLPQGLTHSSGHSFGLLEAIEMARHLNELPPTIVVYAIEGESFGLGTGLSTVVVRCVPGLIRLIEDDLCGMLAPPS